MFLRMFGFITLSGMFIASVALAIMDVANGDPGMALLPVIGALITGVGIAGMMAPPRMQYYPPREEIRLARPAKTLRPLR